MKAQIKAIVASAVVIALCLAAVGGVTYSWFSDTEESDVNVNTAVVDIEITNITKGTTSGLASTSINGASVSITNLAANCIIPLTINIRDNSTINTIYRITTIKDAGTTTDAHTLQNVLLNDITLESMFNGGNPVTDWTPSTPGNSFSIPVTIKTTKEFGDGKDDVWMLTPKPIKLTFIVEAYQSDYDHSSYNGTATSATNAAEYTFTEDMSSKTSASIGGQIVSNGDVNTLTGSAFNVSFNDTALDNVSESTKLTVKQTTPSTGSGNFTISGSDTIAIDLGLSNGTTDFGTNGYADVTITIPGDYSNASVLYNSTTGAQPTVLSSVYNGSTTTLTFRTTHFSEYVITNGSVQVSDAASLTTAFNAGANITISSNITYDNTLRTPNDANMTLDLNGKTLTYAGEGYGLIAINSYLSIIDSGSTGKMTSNNSRLVIVAYGTLDVKGGSFSCSQDADQGIIFMIQGYDDPDTEKTVHLYLGKNVTVGDGSECEEPTTGDDGKTHYYGLDYGVAVMLHSADFTHEYYYGTVIDSEATFISDNSFYITGNQKKTSGAIPIINIRGGTIGTNIYAAGYAQWNVYGGEFKSFTAMEIRAGILNVYGGHFESDSETFSCKSNGNGTTTEGAGLSIAQHTTKLPIDVNIYGGTFKGILPISLRAPEYQADTSIVNVNIFGGTFITTSSNEMYINDTFTGTKTINKEDIEYTNEIGGILNIANDVVLPSNIHASQTTNSEEGSNPSE